MKNFIIQFKEIKPYSFPNSKFASIATAFVKTASGALLEMSKSSRLIEPVIFIILIGLILFYFI